MPDKDFKIRKNKINSKLRKFATNTTLRKYPLSGKTLLPRLNSILPAKFQTLCTPYFV